ncbi:hypothetical protein F5X97DRAFT_179642 [Nemania serpens]|nr:hypothetical protein F5X97DRAFT_179642 [Nemania serpens]
MDGADASANRITTGINKIIAMAIRTTNNSSSNKNNSSNKSSSSNSNRTKSITIITTTTKTTTKTTTTTVTTVTDVVGSPEWWHQQYEIARTFAGWTTFFDFILRVSRLPEASRSSKTKGSHPPEICVTSTPDVIKSETGVRLYRRYSPAYSLIIPPAKAPSSLFPVFYPCRAIAVDTFLIPSSPH